jgi:hypothetical protein
LGRGLAGTSRRRGSGFVHDVEDDAAVQPPASDLGTVAQHQLQGRAEGGDRDHIAWQRRWRTQAQIVRQMHDHVVAILVEGEGRSRSRIDHHTAEAGMAAGPDGRSAGQGFRAAGRSRHGQHQQDSAGRDRPRCPAQDHSKLASNLSISD